MNTLTGSTLKRAPFITIKTGDRMVGRQAAVMRRIRKRHSWIAPRVYMAWETGYAMQTMSSCINWDWRRTLMQLSYVWSYDEAWLTGSQPKFESSAVYEFLDKHDSRLLKCAPPRSMLDIRYGSSKQATHGDPTAENTVIGEYGGYAFIDWLPYRRAFVPADPDADAGKIMQSVLGWETLSNIKDKQIDEALKLTRMYPLAWFWCGMHLERILIRNPSDEANKWCHEAIDTCRWISWRD